MELIVALIMFVGGYELSDFLESEGEPAVTQEMTVIVEAIPSLSPVFERGLYFKSTEGYYISDLSPVPEKVEGCERPVLIADLSEPLQDGAKMNVQVVHMSCES